MQNLKVVAIITFLVIVVCGCKHVASADKFAGIQKKLFELRSYKCTADIRIINNKNTTDYKIHQYYVHPGKYRVEVFYPDNIKGLIMVGNDRNVWVTNPDAVINSKYSSENILNSTGNNTFLTEFFSNYVKSEKSLMTIKDGKYTLSTYISNGNSYIDTEVLTIEADGIPKKMEIFNEKGNLKMQLTYKEFIMNPKLDEKLFE